MHPQLRKSYVLLSCPSVVVFDPCPAVDSQVDVVHSCSPMLVILVVRQAVLVRNDLEKQTPVSHPYLGLGQSSCIPQIKLPLQLLFCSTLEYYIFYIEIVIGFAHHPMNSWYSDISCHHCSFLGSCVIVTGIPTNEL